MFLISVAVAKDKGDPFYSTETFLFISVRDVNDNGPEFPKFAVSTFIFITYTQVYIFFFKIC
jgi:hypothetical protein